MKKISNLIMAVLITIGSILAIDGYRILHDLHNHPEKLMLKAQKNMYKLLMEEFENGKRIK